jgi:ribosomal protein S18 acetylase RimI-like enzyme
MLLLSQSSRMPMSAITIRPATPADAELLVQWQLAMALETEDLRLDPDTVRRGVAGVFEQPARGCYWVAERDGRRVGGLLVTYEWSDWRAGDFHWIQSVYVEPAARGCGVFRALYAAVEAGARTAGAVGLRLYVEHENARAQAAYHSLGMRENDYRFYEARFGPTPRAS